MPRVTPNVNGLDSLFSEYLKVNFQELSSAIKQCSQDNKLNTTTDLRRILQYVQQSERKQNELHRPTSAAFPHDMFLRNMEMLRLASSIPSRSSLKIPSNYNINEQRATISPVNWPHEAGKTTETFKLDNKLAEDKFFKSWTEYWNSTLWEKNQRLALYAKHPWQNNDCSISMHNTAPLAFNKSVVSGIRAREDCFDISKVKIGDESNNVDTVTQKPQLHERSNVNLDTPLNLKSETTGIGQGVDERKTKILNHQEFDQYDKSANVKTEVDVGLVVTPATYNISEKYEELQNKACNVSSVSPVGDSTMKSLDMLKESSNEQGRNAEFHIEEKCNGDKDVQTLGYSEQNSLPVHDLKKPFLELKYSSGSLSPFLESEHSPWSLSNKTDTEWTSSLIRESLNEYRRTFQHSNNAAHSAGIFIDERELENQVFLPRELLQSIME